MGEAVVSSEGRMQFEVQETVVETEMGVQNTAEGGGAAAATAENSAAVQWERFLPKMVVRVLLVEADDSTRQIISALLRKCSYRVAAVSDGLKAWEVLKGRPHSIDLILTEVELPSISGYALLTLIMEHEACKNIPVIMMSSQDSVSTVYKCMLRGATDFLVKPIRKNELRNLWQHVWRKQASSTGAGLGPPDQEKDEATAENNAISNHSSGYMSCIQRNREGIEKGSDAQSSCSKPESETEGEGNDHVLPESTRCLSDGTNISSQEEFHPQNKKRRAFDSETKELQVVADVDAGSAMTRENKNSDDMQEQVKASVENNQFLENSSREAIDLIGAFDNYLKSTFGASFANVNASKLDILPHLDLSLRRSHPSVSVNHVNDEKQMLNHSDSSPFSRYVNKPLQLSMSTSPGTYNQHMDYEPYSEKQPSKTTNHNSDTHGPVLSSPKHVSMATFPTGRPEFPFSCSQNRDISHPIPVRGVRFEGFINGYNPVMPSPYSAQSGSSSLPSPGKAHHTESFPQTAPFYPSEPQPSSSQQLHGFGDQRISNSMDQIVNKQGNKVEDLEDGGLISPGNDQSANSNFCNGNSKINGVSVMNAPSECGSGNEEGFLIHDGASHRSMQREAALTKFRLKRKDRCFEKKVRYESRKKLAEQRPRIKGQFVRQVPNEDQPGNSSAC